MTQLQLFYWNNNSVMSLFLCLCVEDLPPFGAEEYSPAIKLAKKLVLTWILFSYCYWNEKRKIRMLWTYWCECDVVCIAFNDWKFDKKYNLKHLFFFFIFVYFFSCFFFFFFFLTTSSHIDSEKLKDYNTKATGNQSTTE